MAGYLGSRAVFLSTTAVDIDGDNNVGGNLEVGGDVNITGPTPLLTLTDNDVANEYTRIQNQSGNTYIDSRLAPRHSNHKGVCVGCFTTPSNTN